MRQAVEEIGAMTKSLEASGFERREADATIRAIANSIEKFAVTPDVLREAFEEHRSEMKALFKEQTAAISARFEDQRSDTNARFEDHRSDTNARFNDFRLDMNKQFEALGTELRAVTSRLFTLTLTITVGMAGIVGAMIVDKL